ncbi:MAG: hypothetical protein NWE84_02075 [Candidatus Bathyarchaeota archaeon]|nr:hypothetical protein [Candidatus Bathyarchaeota archaeon]
MTGKKTNIVIVMLLIFAMVVLLFALPSATAQVSPRKKTYAVCGLTPNPVGVNQEVLVWLGITDQLGVYTDGWEGLTVTVKKPDGKTETLGTFKTDATGSTGTVYLPDLVGNYTFQTHFPEQEYNWTAAAERTMIIFDPTLSGVITYEASDSPEVTLIVQEEPLDYYPGNPLPDQFWTRPINAQLREWNAVGGNWYNIPPNKFAQYNEGPETSHILWTKPLATGGLVGGELGPHAYEEGDAYEGKFGDWSESAWGGGSSVIINGVLYYNRFTTGAFVMPPFVESMWKQQGIMAVDVRTGEELWFRNNTRLTFGQVFYWDAWNYHGAFAYLWEITQNFNFFTGGMDNTWRAFDAFTGEFAYGMTNVPDGNRIYGPNGEIYIYEINLEQGWIALWNSTRVVNPQLTGESADGSWGSNANIQKMFDARTGYEWNKTIPLGLPGSAIAVFFEDRIIGSDAVLFKSRFGEPPVALWAVSTKPEQEGTLLYNKTWQPPAGHYSIGFGAASLEDDVFTLWSKEQRAHYGFSITNGEEIWGPTPSQAQLDIFDIENAIAYGKLFSVGMSGIVYAYDVKTGGSPLWNYVADDPYNEILWSNNWPLNQLFITDGKIYLGHSEHSPVDPKSRGAPFICLDVETGEEIWRIDGAFRTTRWGGNAIIADSIIALMDTYDNRVYAVGKGPSATSVMASPKISIEGTTVMVEGMVSDISAGTREDALMARFPNGVPAVSDADMSDWMLHVYMQFERPSDATGVEVAVSVLDPNNNSYEVARTTSYANGFYSCTFRPEVPGEYIIVATFAGSKAYYGSFAETAINVEETPQPTPLPTPVPQEPVGTYFTVSTGLIIAAIAIAVFLMLRKR